MKEFLNGAPLTQKWMGILRPAHFVYARTFYKFRYFEADLRVGLLTNSTQFEHSRGVRAVAWACQTCAGTSRDVARHISGWDTIAMAKHQVTINIHGPAIKRQSASEDMEKE